MESKVQDSSIAENTAIISFVMWNRASLCRNYRWPIDNYAQHLTFRKVRNLRTENLAHPPHSRELVFGVRLQFHEQRDIDNIVGYSGFVRA